LRAVKPLPALGLTLLAALAFAGCGQDKKTANSASTPAATTSTPATTPPAGGTGTAAPAGANTDLTKKPTIAKGSGPAPKTLVVQDIVTGSGPGAKRGDQLTMQYVGALYDTGQEFDASWDRGQPFPLQLGVQPVIEGWQRGLIGMKKGGRRQLIIPPSLGYGAQGQGPIPPNATLVFIVDRLS
jgi:peptidylprolyl isomerase